MKKTLKAFIMMIVAFTIISCSNEESKTVENEANYEIEMRSSDIYVGEVANGKINLLVDKSSILSKWNKTLEESEIFSEVSSLEIFELDGHYYVTARGNGIKSTKSLILNGTILSFKNQISCSTIDCSDTEDCIPIGLKCSPCPNNGECMKTVSNIFLDN